MMRLLTVLTEMCHRRNFTLDQKYAMFRSWNVIKRGGRTDVTINLLFRETQNDCLKIPLRELCSTSERISALCTDSAGILSLDDSWHCCWIRRTKHVILHIQNARLYVKRNGSLRVHLRLLHETLHAAKKKKQNNAKHYSTTTVRAQFNYNNNKTKFMYLRIHVLGYMTKQTT